MYSSWMEEMERPLCRFRKTWNLLFVNFKKGILVDKTTLHRFINSAQNKIIIAETIFLNRTGDFLFCVLNRNYTFITANVLVHSDPITCGYFNFVHFPQLYVCRENCLTKQIVLNAMTLMVRLQELCY